MYGKVFESMFDGTLVSRGPWQALVTFQQMIVLADRDGVVDMTADAISRRTSIPLEIIELGIDSLMRPDPKSRTPDEEGRRITLLEDHRDWGWQIVNHAKYQAIRSAEERREYLRVAQANRRARIKQESAAASTLVNTVNQSQPESTPEPVSAPEPKRKEDSGASPSAKLPPPSFSGENSEQIPARAIVALSPDWGLPQSWGVDAERLGWPGGAILKEAEKFRQYWVSGKGSGKRRTVKGWRQSWSNWIAKAGAIA
jgi:hypothetical protein